MADGTVAEVGEGSDTSGAEPVAADAAAGPHEELGWDWRRPSVGGAVLLALMVVGIRTGLAALHDNSFMTHLATGRLILDHGSIPRADPYSWTAHGEPWTVQSWGASVVYGTAERIGGLTLIRAVNATLIVVLILLLWRLTAVATGLVGRLLVNVLIVAMGASLWVERPLLFGAVFLVLVLCAAEDQLDPRWLVPVMWLWVNMHGSFPFGILVLVVLALGRWLDERTRPVVELRALGWATLGTLLGAVGPLGPKLLLFPLQLLSRREAFARIEEWKPPTWDYTPERLFAVQLALAVLLVLMRARRWRLALPTVVFGVLALTSTRNVLQASLVLTPVLAAGVAGVGSIRASDRPELLRPVAWALSVLVVLSVGLGLAGPDTELSAYPVEATTWMRHEGLLDVEDRVVSRDFVGNYLAFRWGPDEVRGFMDDRVDMFPVPVIEDYLVLLEPGGAYQAVLEKYRATAVLWDRDTPLGRWLEKSDRWRVVHRDEVWLVAVPRTD